MVNLQNMDPRIEQCACKEASLDRTIIFYGPVGGPEGQEGRHWVDGSAEGLLLQFVSRVFVCPWRLLLAARLATVSCSSADTSATCQHADTSMRQCTHPPMHPHTNVPTHRHAHAPMRQRADALRRQRVDAPTHPCANTPTCNHTPTRSCTNAPMYPPTYPRTHASMHQDDDMPTR